MLLLSEVARLTGVRSLVIAVANPVKPAVAENVEFAVGSGAAHPVVPGRVLRRLGIRPLKRETFYFVNGASVVRGKATALFRYEDRIGSAPVIFGEEGDATLLGELTLEALGLAADPIRTSS